MTTKNADVSPRSLISSDALNTETNLRKSSDVFSNLKVSFYKRHDLPDPIATHTIGDALQSFRSTMYQKEIELVRQQRKISKDAARPFKDKLPGYSFAGTFNKRNNASLDSSTGVICLDFDDLDSDPCILREELKSVPFVYAAWLSPSGLGVKALAVIPCVGGDSDFKVIFSHLNLVLSNLDTSCKDISRLCYVSYDPDLWVNPEAEMFNPEIEDEPEAPTFHAPVGRDDRPTISDHDFTLAAVKYYVGELMARSFSCDEYNDWLLVGFELASIGEDGRDFFHELSGTSAKYDRQTCDDKFTDLIKKHNGSRKIGSFIKRCTDQGIDEFHPHGGKPQRREVPTIKLPEGIQFNIITHGLTYDGKPLSNKKLHDLWWSTAKRPGFDNYYHQLIALAPTWNPYTEFFSIPWSGIDQFERLGKYIDTDEGFTKELRRHIIRGINQLLGEPGSKTHHINRFAFILQGGMNIGKSEFLRRLTLRDVLPGFSSEIDMAQSKTEVHRLLCQCVNLINEEIDSVTAQEIRNLKPIISYSGGSLRLPYDRTPTQMQRIATLWGSVNPGEFLLETNDRWIVYEIRKIDFGYTAAVDFEDLWRQCFADWKRNPLSGELTKSEVDELSKKASEHLIVSPLEQYIRSRYMGDSNVQPMSLHDIRMEVIGSYQNVNDKQLGRVMMAAFGKFRAGRQMVNGVRGTLYCVRLK